MFNIKELNNNNIYNIEGFEIINYFKIFCLLFNINYKEEFFNNRDLIFSLEKKSEFITNDIDEYSNIHFENNNKSIFSVIHENICIRINKNESIKIFGVGNIFLITDKDQLKYYKEIKIENVIFYYIKISKKDLNNDISIIFGGNFIISKESNENIKFRFNYNFENKISNTSKLLRYTY